MMRRCGPDRRCATVGAHYLADGVTFLPTPLQRPGIPIWLAARTMARAPLRRAARHDGLFPIEVDAGRDRGDARLHRIRARLPRWLRRGHHRGPGLGSRSVRGGRRHLVDDLVRGRTPPSTTSPPSPTPARRPDRATAVRRRLATRRRGRRARSLPRPAEPGVRWVPPESWHVTLRFLGRCEIDDATSAVRSTAFERLADGDRPMAELGPAVSRLGRNVICVPCSGLDPLAALVVDVDGRSWADHRTRGPSPVTSRWRRLAHRGACRLAGHPVGRSFAVTEVTVVVSEGGPAGPRYEVVDRISIVDGP